MPHAQKFARWEFDRETELDSDADREYEDSRLYHDGPQTDLPPLARTRAPNAREFIMEAVRRDPGMWLRRAFRMATGFELENLAGALRKRRLFCCGATTHLYADGKGAWSPEVIAAGGVLPAGEVMEKAANPGTAHQRWHDVLHRWNMITDGLYLEALMCSDQETIKSAIAVVVEERGLAAELLPPRRPR